jgi:hypothetical protein
MVYEPEDCGSHFSHSILLLKQQFIISHLYTAWQEAEETWLILNKPTLQPVTFLRKYKDKQNFCGHIVTEGVFITQLS